MPVSTHSTDDFDHRKQWLVDRLHLLSEVFSVDVCAYAVMSNHLHLVLRVDRERAESWDAYEVVARFGRLYRMSLAAYGVRAARRVGGEAIKDIQCAGIVRQVAENERVLLQRSSDPW